MLFKRAIAARMSVPLLLVVKASTERPGFTLVKETDMVMVEEVRASWYVPPYASSASPTAVPMIPGTRESPTISAYAFRSGETTWSTARMTKPTS